MSYAKQVWEIEKVLVTVKVSTVPTSEYYNQTNTIITWPDPYFTSIEVPTNGTPLQKVFAKIKDSASALVGAEPYEYVFKQEQPQ